MKMWLIYPALYQLQNGPVRVWFRLDELLVAVKTEFCAHRWPTIASREDLLTDYWLLNLGDFFLWSDGESLFQAKDPTDVFDIFESRGKQTIYVPAGWGEAVLTAVERGARKVVIEPGCVPVGCGVQSEDETVMIHDLVWSPGRRKKMTRCA